MSQFIQIQVMTDQGGGTKPVCLNTRHITQVESCNYEGSIQGVQKTGTAIFCAGNMYVTPTDYDKISRALMMGKFDPELLLN